MPRLRPTGARDETTTTETGKPHPLATTRNSTESLLADNSPERIARLIQVSDEAFKADAFALPSPDDPSRAWYFAEEPPPSPTPPGYESSHTPIRHFSALAKRALPIFKRKPRKRDSRMGAMGDITPPSSIIAKTRTIASPRWKLTGFAESVTDLFAAKRNSRDSYPAVNDLVVRSSKLWLDAGRSESRQTNETPMLRPLRLRDLPAHPHVPGLANSNVQDTPRITPAHGSWYSAPRNARQSLHTPPHQKANNITPPTSPREGDLGEYSRDLSPLVEAQLAITLKRRSLAWQNERVRYLRERKARKPLNGVMEVVTTDFPNGDVRPQGLMSTPISAISPGVRHGPIQLIPRTSPAVDPQEGSSVRSSASSAPRLAVNLVGEHVLNGEGSDRRTLRMDWTAFQLAMAGVTGNHLMGDPETMAPSHEARLVREEAEQEAEEIIEWWAGFGLDAGRLDRGPEAVLAAELPATRISGSSLMFDDSCDDSCDDSGVDFSHTSPIEEIMHSLERCHIARALREEDEGLLEPNPMEDTSLAQMRRWGSLYVPMGHNMQHDLRDFLRGGHNLVATVDELTVC